MEELKKIWLDGKFVDWKKANIHILTHGLHYGSGVFEGIRAYKTDKGRAVFRLDEHIDRFFYSASCLGMNIPFSEREIKEAVLENIKINEISECYIRPIAFFGYGIMGLNPKKAPVRTAIIIWPWKNYLGKDIVKVKISKYIRLHPRSIIVKAKICGYYVNSILAALDAQKSGFDESLLLDFEGNIAEGPGENIFIVKDKRICTPSSGTILAGITRDTVIKIAKDLGIGLEERKISQEELKFADEAFFVGTAAGICPIGKIDDTVIGDNRIGEITRQIEKSYHNIIYGKNEKYLDWLTFV